MRRKFSGTTLQVVTAYCIVVVLIHLYILYLGTYTVTVQRSLHLALLISLAFLFYPARKSSPLDRPTIPDLVLAILAFFSFFYLTANSSFIEAHTTLTGPISPIDVLMGTMAILLILEASRRVVGLAFAVIGGCFVLLVMIGPYLPGYLKMRGFNWSEVVDLLYLGPEGLLGIPVQVSYSYIFPLVLFSSFLGASGAAKFFADLARSAFAKSVGGAAKANIVANYLLGMITGNAVANVYLTANLGSEEMKRQGYRVEEIGAIIAAAATGAQLSPPVMGAVAFVMAHYLGVSYLSVAIAAIIPAFLYYLSLFLVADFKARKLGSRTVQQSESPTLKQVLREGWHLLIPLILFVILLVLGYSITRIAIYCTLVTIPVSYLRKHTRLGVEKLIHAIRESAVDCVLLATVLAVSGLVFGSISVTGLGFKLTRIALDLSGGQLLLLLLLTMVANIILGMGTPPTAVYVIEVALLVPALAMGGVDLFSAHFFIFFFACLAVITPPVANASYAAAQILKGDLVKTGFESVKVALAGFVIPFAFVMNPGLLLQSSWLSTVAGVATASVAIFALSAAICGYLLGDLSLPKRLVLAVLGIVETVINNFAGTTEIIITVVGFSVIFAIIAAQYVSWRKKRVAAQQITSAALKGAWMSSEG